MSKNDIHNQNLPSLYPRTDKDSVPIRSFIYKKSSSIVNDNTQKKSARISLSEIPYSVLAGNSNIKPLKIPTDVTQTAQTHRDLSQPRIAYQIHKVTLGSSKTKVQTARNSPLHPVKTLQKLQVRSQVNSRRASPTGVTERRSEQSDYFDILRDENRQTFKVEDFEGVDDFSNEVVMSRIYKQGFRDPPYYSKAVNFDMLKAPDEKTIKEKYMVRIAPWVGAMENKKSEVTHVLGGTVNNMSYVESLLQAAQEGIEESKRMKNELKAEIDALNKNFSDELENIISDYSKKFKGIDDCIKADYMKKQTEGFKLQKEVIILKREKMSMERQVEEAVNTLNEVEDALYGRNIFQLEAVHKGLDNISDLNLRCERMALMKNSGFIH